MNIDSIIFILFLGILLFASISFVPYISFLKIFPFKPKGYEQYQKKVQSESYKKHKRKWCRIHLLSVPKLL